MKGLNDLIFSQNLKILHLYIVCTYYKICLNHTNKVNKIKLCLCYHFGSNTDITIFISVPILSMNTPMVRILVSIYKQNFNFLRKSSRITLYFIGKDTYNISITEKKNTFITLLLPTQIFLYTVSYRC